jgi:hypothetical protein
VYVINQSHLKSLKNAKIIYDKIKKELIKKKINSCSIRIDCKHSGWRYGWEGEQTESVENLFSYFILNGTLFENK